MYSQSDSTVFSLFCIIAHVFLFGKGFFEIFYLAKPVVFFGFGPNPACFILSEQVIAFWLMPQAKGQSRPL
ncbi:hypothetical protein CLOSTMETH_00708 [[Clostridium] methylpentosum DSM 5476]|uniref:Uncharacterized protein n=1 Tax=[Clostridium] methylpentosum DSM 5476 TaxID=537013 RepID=C0EA54_9FIRM|nr:hypothetical protein CLOSTMETH_00708 [[Clostridium] methylpentosum DSM 5476]